jgi:hypothetical protein
MEKYSILFEEDNLIYIKINNDYLKLSLEEYNKWKQNKLET